MWTGTKPEADGKAGPGILFCVSRAAEVWGGKMFRQFKWLSELILFAIFCGGSLLASGAPDQSSQAAMDQDPAVSNTAAAVPVSAVPSRNHHNRQSMLASGQSRSERTTYEVLAGIDRLRVEETASGALIRVSYRVLDATKAKALHDEKSKAYLVDKKTNAVLQVPDLPKVGELRPKSTPVSGKEYWLVFSNKGVVKPGGRVDFVVGNFRAMGLLVR